ARGAQAAADRRLDAQPPARDHGVAADARGRPERDLSARRDEVVGDLAGEHVDFAASGEKIARGGVDERDVIAGEENVFEARAMCAYLTAGGSDIVRCGDAERNVVAGGEHQL